MRIRQSAEYAALRAGSAAGSIENTADWFAHLAILLVEIAADVQEDGLVARLEIDEAGKAKLREIVDAAEPTARGVLAALPELIGVAVSSAQVRVRLGEEA